MISCRFSSKISIFWWQVNRPSSIFWNRRSNRAKQSQRSASPAKLSTTRRWFFQFFSFYDRKTLQFDSKIVLLTKKNICDSNFKTYNVRILKKNRNVQIWIKKPSSRRKQHVRWTFLDVRRFDFEQKTRRRNFCFSKQFTTGASNGVWYEWAIAI